MPKILFSNKKCPTGVGKTKNRKKEEKEIDEKMNIDNSEFLHRNTSFKLKC